MEKVLYKLKNFEGPLDLLLHLITKNKINIYDIPIVEITDHYLDALSEFDAEQLDSTSEFLVMAAQLLYIKSKMLLPKPEVEEEEDPRDDLTRRLLEYKKFKEASTFLRENEFKYSNLHFKNEEKIDFPAPPYEHKHNLSEIEDAIFAIRQRKMRKAKPKKKAFLGIVGREKVSVDDMVEKVCKLLAKKRALNFKSIFEKKQSKPERIATFLAVLEMIRLNRISADYDILKKDYVITKNADKEVENG